MSEPARLASAGPEDPGTVEPVSAVGIGPGDPAYLTGRARDLIAGADVVVGFESVLECLPDDTGADELVATYDDQEAVLAAFADRVAAGEAGVAALMGDPNVSGYAFLGRIERALDRPVRVIPGVSSVQVAAGRARTPIEESTVVSLHRRGDLGDDLDRLARDAGDRHLIVLPRPYDWMPPDIAAHLVERGADGTATALVFERLTMDGGSRTRTTLGDLAGSDASFSDLSVLVARRP